jgi:hypothetical protein
MRYLRVSSAFLLLLASGQPAVLADEVPRGFVDGSFIARAWQLHDWIIEHTDYQPLDKLPVFLFVGISELNYLALNETEKGYSGERLGIEGVYAPSIVFLRDDFRLGARSPLPGDLAGRVCLYRFEGTGGLQAAGPLRLRDRRWDGTRARVHCLCEPMLGRVRHRPG